MNFKKILLSSVVLFFGMNSFSYAENMDINQVKKKLKEANIDIRFINYGYQSIYEYQNISITDEQIKCIGLQVVEIDKFKKSIKDNDPLKGYLRKNPSINLDFNFSLFYSLKTGSSSTDKAITFNFVGNDGCQVVAANTLYTKYSEFYRDHVAPEKNLNAALANLIKPEAKNNLSCNEGPRNAKARDVEANRATASSESRGR